MNTYTLITGASEGIGKALALECAKRNMNLLLVALPGIELYQLASYIRKQYNVKVCEVETDLSEEDNCLAIWKLTRKNNLRVNMLINNAGIGGTRMFQEAEFETWNKHIQLNVTSVVYLTHLFLPELKRHDQSYILNISSLAVFFCMPGKQVYGATKSFVYFFSKTLYRELKSENVHVSVICPGGISSNPVLYLMNHHNNWITRSASMTPESLAETAIANLLNKKEVIIPGKWNRLFVFFNKILPGSFKERLLCSQKIKIKQEYAEALVRGNLLSNKKTA
jgi:short-subunit dehydrogenase